MSGGLAAFGGFHFLRPGWLWLALPAALVVWLVSRREDPSRPFKGLVAPHLLPHLLVGAGRRWGIRPLHHAAFFFAVATLALAGPAWQREDPPFAQDKAALVVALDLSRSMDAIDESPSRLVRGQQKIRDLLARRTGARTALVAYAGTAHTVLPLTEDTRVLTTYLDALSTGLMPVPGKDAAAALARCEALLAREPVPGTILFVTDGISTAQTAAFVAHRSQSRNAVAVLGVGTSEGGPIREGKGFVTEGGRRVVARLDRDGLLALAREAHAFVATATLDDRDVAQIQGGIEAHLQQVVQKDERSRYRDVGWYATPFLALLAGLWFRRGFTVRWAALLALAVPSSAGAADGSFWDLWATRDQQAHAHFARGDYAAAAARFEDPLWRGTACYRAGDYACAVDAFARVDSPRAWYDLGNAYARQGELRLALASYDKALQGRPGWPDARANRARVAGLLPPEKKPDEDEGQADPSLKPDEVKIDDKGKKGRSGPVEVKVLTDEQIAQMWLRGVHTSPAGFLRSRFAVQAAASRPAATGAPPPKPDRPPTAPPPKGETP